MSADNWRTLNRLIADPVFSRERVAAARAGLARPRDHRDDDAVRLRARRHDARHRLALPVDRPAHRAAVDAVHRAAGGDRATAARTGLDWLLDLADSTVTYRSRYLVAPGVAAGARPAGARRRQSALAGVPGQGPGRVRRQARDDATAASRATCSRRRRPRCAPCGRPTCTPRARRWPTCSSSCSARAGAVSDELTLKFFSHAVVAQRAVAGGLRPLSLPHGASDARYRVEHETRYALPRAGRRSRGSSRA